jgi:protein phosphatase
MAQDHAKFSMMATTIVGLHIKGNIATIGHVGDSRLYRLTPGGQLLRETDDHSVVEEEVRAGRMTADQAANHPSKNVISRALGAEDDVDVDMKVVEVDDGTQFLLCTDGITRHIPDHELRQLLLTTEDLTSACEEMKRRCFERGAEDNLTAILVSVGAPISPQDRAEDVEKTISPETVAVAAIPATPVTDPAWVAPAFVPASRRAFPGKGEDADTLETPLNIPPTSHERTGVERTMTRFFVFVLFIVALAGAFYAGRRYRGSIPYVDQGQVSEAPASVPSPTAATDDVMISFETARRRVDSDPRAWLSNTLASELSRQGIQAPLQSSDPSFLYLYGRASLLTANYEEAAPAFEAAIAKADLNPSPANTTLRTEATLGLTAVAMKAPTAGPAASRSLEQALQKANPSTPLPNASPSISP